MNVPDFLCPSCHQPVEVVRRVRSEREVRRLGEERWTGLALHTLIGRHLAVWFRGDILSVHDPEDLAGALQALRRARMYG